MNIVGTKQTERPTCRAVNGPGCQMILPCEDDPNRWRVVLFYSALWYGVVWSGLVLYGGVSWLLTAASSSGSWTVTTKAGCPRYLQSVEL